MANQIPLVNYEGGELSFDNPLEVASDAAEGIKTAGVNCAEGDADTKAKVIIGGLVGLAQYGINKKLNKVGPHPDAAGPHTSFITDSPGGTITGYTTFDGSGNAIKRFRNSGKPHGGVEPPLVYQKKPGERGANAPLKRARPANSDEILKRNN